MKWREWINLKCAGVALYIQLRKHSRREIPRTSLCSASSSQPEPFPAQPLIKPTPVFFSSSPQKEKKKKSQPRVENLPGSLGARWEFRALGTPEPAAMQASPNS